HRAQLAAGRLRRRPRRDGAPAVLPEGMTARFAAVAVTRRAKPGEHPEAECRAGSRATPRAWTARASLGQLDVVVLADRVRPAAELQRQHLEVEHPAGDRPGLIVVVAHAARVPGPGLELHRARVPVAARVQLLDEDRLEAGDLQIAAVAVGRARLREL